MCSAYHPQTDGQTEALNKCLEMYLRCFIVENPRAWVDFLPWTDCWYNTSYHTCAEVTLFQAVYGQFPPQLLTYYSNDNDPLVVYHLLQQRDKIHS